MSAKGKPDDDRAFHVELRPAGRGNWRVVEVVMRGRHGPLPMLVHRGDRVVMGQSTYRVVRVWST